MKHTRKEFLKSSLILTAGLFSPRASSAQHDASDSMRRLVKITNLKTYVLKNATFVKIETDAGVSGWGEADHDYPALTSAVIHEICKREVIGKDPFDTEYMWQQMFFKGEDAGTTGLLPGAVAGVDNALWDLKGRLLNMPVHKIAGSFGREKVRVYGSFAREIIPRQERGPRKWRNLRPSSLLRDTKRSRLACRSDN